MPLGLRHASLAVAVASPVVLLLLRERAERRRLEEEVVKHREAAERQTRLRDEERRGRTRAEQRLRKLGTVNGSEDQELAAGGLDPESSDSPGFVFNPIGTFSSCYRSRCGTPRQGGIVRESLAVLHCSRDLNPTAALEGFSAFSHCWVVYVFHENTNLQREGTSMARRQQNGGLQQRGRVPLWQGLCMKVAPPRCLDKSLRVGVLSCRTPHRPNPIGLSLARIVRVDTKAGQVILAGLDVVDGTPCLDLKPYLPIYECVPSAIVPSWVQASFEEPLMRVSWLPSARAALKALYSDDVDSAELNGSSKSGQLKTWPFGSTIELAKALEGTLALDIRSPVQRQRHPNPGAAVGQGPAGSEPFFVGDLWFHELHITYALFPAQLCQSGQAEACVRIESVEQRTPQSASPASRDPIEAEHANSSEKHVAP